MGKYSSYQRKVSLEDRAKSREIHPIWRGIGLVLMILVPGMAYALTLLTLQQNTINRWVPIPKEILFTQGGDSLLFVKILLTFVFCIVLYGFLSFLGFLIYRFVGPPRYGPLDVPPVSYRGKAYKR